jgi:hypothetical protein
MSSKPHLPRVTCDEIQRAFPQLLTALAGDPQVAFEKVQSPELAERNSLIFLGQPKSLEVGLKSVAPALVVPSRLLPELEAKRGQKTLIGSPNVELAMASVINHFFYTTPYRGSWLKGVHATALVSSVRSG